MSRVHLVSNSTFAIYNLALRAEKPRRDPDPFLVALGVNVVLGVVIAVIYTFVR